METTNRPTITSQLIQLRTVCRVPRLRSRAQTYREEVANSVSHGIGLFFALIAAPLLVANALRSGDAHRIIACSIYASTIVLMFAASMVYHGLPRGRAKFVCRIIDHGAIFLLIAGSYTPFMLGALWGPWGWTLLAFVWTFAIIGVVLTAISRVRYPTLSTLVYLLLGWMIVVGLKPLWLHMNHWGLVWIAAQSIALFIAICYRWSWYEAQLFTPPYFGFQVLAFAIVELIGREASGRTALARTNAELVSTRELLAEHVRLAERRWIGRELHDAMGHHLAGLSLHLEALAQREAPSPPLDIARALTRRLLDDVESLVTTLERDRGVDLAGALGALATEIPSPRVHVEIDGLAQQAPARAHALLRCCQEIVTNAIKHAGADNLWIRLRERDGRVELIARDDGKRPPIARTGHGLDGMRQRLAELGGSLEVASPPGGGFELRVLVPEADR